MGGIERVLREIPSVEKSTPARQAVNIWSLLTRSFSGIEVPDFGDGRERHLDDLTVSTFHLHTRRRQRLRGFHAENHAADALAVHGRNLNIVFPIEGLKSCKGLGDFHDCQCFLPVTLDVGL